MILLHELQVVATLMLCGLIWTVQLVLYPSFRLASERGFDRFHSFYCQRITWLVAVLMPLELVLAALVVAYAPEVIPLLGLVLVTVIWLSTVLLQVPAHRQLAAAFDTRAHRRLVRTNWVRTAAWSIRGVLVLAVLP